MFENDETKFTDDRFKTLSKVLIEHNKPRKRFTERVSKEHNFYACESQKQQIKLRFNINHVATFTDVAG